MPLFGKLKELFLKKISPIDIEMEGVYIISLKPKIYLRR